MAFNPFPDAYAAGRRTGIVVHGLDQTKRQMRLFAPDLLKQMNFEVRRNILGPIVKDAKTMVPSAPPLTGSKPSRWNQSVARPGSRRSYSPHGKRWEYGRLEWNSRQVKQGIRVGVGTPRRRGDTFRGAYAILNRDPAGAVYELMGSGKSNVNMVRNVRASHGPAKRLIWRAWEKANANRNVPLEVVDTIRRFEALFQERLDQNARGIR